MIGLLITDMERREIEYLIKREFEELLLDLGDHRIDQVIKQSMIERYKVLFHLFRKVASEEECLKYMLQENKYYNG